MTMAVQRSAYYWSPQQERMLESWYGRMPDTKLAEMIGRPYHGMRAKAEALGLRKAGESLTSTHVAELLGVSPRTVVHHWIGKGLLDARRGYKKGPHRLFLVEPEALEAFIRSNSARAVPTRMPRSYYRELAVRVRAAQPFTVRRHLVRQQIRTRRCLLCFAHGGVHQIIVGIDGSVMVFGEDRHAYDPGDRRLLDRGHDPERRCVA